MQTGRVKIHLSFGSQFMADLDRHRGRELRSHYIERMLSEHWARNEFRRPEPDSPSPAEQFFVGRR